MASSLYFFGHAGLFGGAGQRRRFGGYIGGVDRPSRFEHHRFIGDKRNQRVYDLDEYENQEVIDELIESEQYTCFGPDTLAEARNRCYRPARN